MASTYTDFLGIEKPATGEQEGAWGTTVNLNYDMFDQAICGIASVILGAAGTSGSPNTLAITDGAVSDGRNKFITFTDGGDLGADVFVQLTPDNAEKICYIQNSLSGSQDLYLFQGTYDAGRDFVVTAGTTVMVKFSGGGAGASTVTEVLAGLQIQGTFTADVTGTLQTAAQPNITSVGTLTGFTSTGIDDNATAERLQLADTTLSLGPAGAATSMEIRHAATANDGVISLVGGGGAGGGQIQLYGPSHASAADIRLRANGSTVLLWDEANTRFNFQGNTLFNAGTLTCGTFTSTGIDDNATTEQLQIDDTDFYIKNTLRVGAHNTIGAETVTGYITIKEANGNSRKIAVVS